MACFKTGAVVHMIPHDLVFAADIWRVEGAWVVRANGPLHRGHNAFSPKDAHLNGFREPTHELQGDNGAGFWRDDLGIWVVPGGCFREVA